MNHSLRTMMATSLLVVGATVAIAGPAEAAPPDGCRNYYSHHEVAGSYITASAYRVCLEGEDTPLSVKIELYLSPNAWLTVAQGVGTTTYYCNGMAYNVYRTTGTPEFPILCG